MRIAIIDPSGFTLPYDHCLATALSRQGCQVLLVTNQVPPGVWTRDTAYERLVLFYRFTDRITKSRIRTYLKGCEHPFNMMKLINRLRHWKPDVIHFQWIPLPIIDGFFLRCIRKIAPLVLTVHDTEPFHGAPSSRIQLIGLVSAFRHFDHYIVHTHYSREVFRCQLSVPDHNVTVIPHGIFNYYRELVSDLGDPSHQDIMVEGKKIVLFFGVLKPYKGVDILLEAFARLPDLLAKKTILKVIGHPKIPIEPLQSLAQRLGVENRVFWDLRFVEEKEVALSFAGADIVVLPYRRIDQSGVLMVALAFGKPVIASRLGGFMEIIDDGVDGLLVNPGDVESLTRALICLLENNEIYTRIAKAIEKKAAGELSWDNIAEQTVRLYQSVL